MKPLSDLAKLCEAATPGPWYFNSYCRVSSSNAELVKAQRAAYDLIPDDEDPPEGDPRWAQISAAEKPLGICEVPRRSGDTATAQGAKNANYIAALDPATVLAIIASHERLRKSLERIASDEPFFVQTGGTIDLAVRMPEINRANAGTVCKLIAHDAIAAAYPG